MRFPRGNTPAKTPHRILRENLQLQRLLNRISAKQETEDSVGISPVRLGNRTYRAWGTAKLTPMVLFIVDPLCMFSTVLSTDEGVLIKRLSRNAGVNG